MRNKQRNVTCKIYILLGGGSGARSLRRVASFEQKEGLDTGGVGVSLSFHADDHRRGGGGRDSRGGRGGRVVRFLSQAAARCGFHP